VDLGCSVHNSAAARVSNLAVLRRRAAACITGSANYPASNKWPHVLAEEGASYPGNGGTNVARSIVAFTMSMSMCAAKHAGISPLVMRPAIVELTQPIARHFHSQHTDCRSIADLQDLSGRRLRGAAAAAATAAASASASAAAAAAAAAAARYLAAAAAT
jgi:hypothetical protein